jgi:hypothetical protein
MKMKKPKILTMHQSTNMIDFGGLETKEMSDFINMKTSYIGV